MDKKKRASMASYDAICDAKKRLVESVVAELSQGIDRINADELSKAVDMIKDLAEAEKLCHEACYYESIVEAMEESSEQEHGDRYGYRRQTMPKSIEPPYIYYDDGVMPMNARMGFPKSMGRSMNRGSTRRGRDSMGRFTSGGRSGYDDGEMWDDDGQDDWSDPRYGQAYNAYRNARKHYTETHTQTDKEMMDRKANEHIADTVATIRDMWKDADPALRKRMKADFSTLLNEMNG